MADEGHLLQAFRQIFRRFDLNLQSTISREELRAVCTKSSSQALFLQLTSGESLKYSDLESWFTSQGAFEHMNCCCSDGHDLSPFEPESDGWCCEECGEDLHADQRVWRCKDCDGLCWCAQCIIETVDVKTLEKTLLNLLGGAKTDSVASSSTASTAASSAAAESDVADSPQTANGSTPRLTDSTESPNASPMKRYRKRGTLDVLNEGKGTPAEEQYIQDLVSQLPSRHVDLQMGALGELQGFVKDRRLAAAVSEHMLALVSPFDKSDTCFHSEMLTFLRCLVDHGQAETVASHSYAYVPCLAHGDLVVARKAAMLFCSIAREGSAELVTRYVPKLMECCERLNYSITAPLEALQAISDSGEALAVAPVLSRCLPKLRSGNVRNKTSICNLLGSVFAKGGGGPIYDLVAEDSADSPLGALLCLVRDEEDSDVCLAAALALQSIILFKEKTVALLKDRHSLLMFNCLGKLQGTLNREARSIIKEILGLDLSSHDGKETLEGDDGTEVCAICFTVGLRCQRGGPQSLQCGHTFHANCIDDWYNWEKKCGRERTCPLCRRVESSPGKSSAGQGASSPARRIDSVTRLRTTVNAARQCT
eukprot:TRINITY_DN96070_c0_g1_i1.p1 TRINITY_DN96070_c0_g1~~TRINITY_DN96070_c0_g1_i1.p1  ORF type:complete len:595 (-),score=78.83 TRINITY_DN96070_c0_g1_i1:138-1922(-)